MIPPKRDKKDFERVAIGEFITGVIEDINYDMEHKFSFQGKEKISPAVRFVFRLDGYTYKHYSRWMYFGYGSKSGLFAKYIVKLVENAQPDMENFDLDVLKGMAVKTIWSENGDFQNIDNIFPLKGKVKADTVVSAPAGEEQAEPHDGDEGEGEPPF